jgi:hypothetical protein
MNCDRVTELLPWLENGTLGPDERAGARAHLAACAACRRDLDEARFAVAVHTEHLPADAIVDYAFDRLPDRAFVDRHLRACTECAELLDLARESRRLEEAEPVAGSRPSLAYLRGRSYWITAALAASLAVSLGLAGWLWARWQEDRALVASTAARKQELDERLSRLEGERLALEAENRRLREETAARTAIPAPAAPETRRPAPSAPELNVPAFDLYPDGLVRRGDSVANELAVPASSATAMFVLNSETSPASGPLGLEIADEAGRVVWRGAGLVRRATGEYTVAVPTRLLPTGRYTLTVYSGSGRARAPLERYRFRVNRASPRG